MFDKRLLIGVLLIIGIMAVPAPVAAEITGASASDTTIDGGDPEDHTVTISDDGNATSYSVQISDTPSGVTVDGLPSGTTSGSGAGQDVTVTIDADKFADSGTVSGDVNGEGFSFYVEVNTPPRPGFEEEPFDAGEVLVEDTTSGQLTVEEVTGSGTQDGIEYDIIDSPSGASLSFPGGLDYGSSSWEIDVGNVDQHETLTWTVELWNTGDSSGSREVDVEARVIYPGYIESASMDDGNIEFDQPKQSTDSFSDEVYVEVENGGDLPLELSSVSASSTGSGISVQGAGTREISAGGTNEIDLDVSASTDLSEGEYPISGSVYTAPGGSDSFSGDISINHQARLSAGPVSIGDVPIGQTKSGSVSISEELGYKSINDIQLKKQSGPSWISVTDQPGGVTAGGETTASFSVSFDAQADPGSTYEWEYLADGSSGSSQFTVTSTPIPLDMEPIQDSISEYQSPVADETLNLVNQMDQQIRSGATQQGQISTTLAFADSAEIYIQSVDEASDLISEDRHVEAQSSVMRAASAFNTLKLYSSEFESRQLSSTSDTVLSQANDELKDAILEQREYYETQIRSGGLTDLEETRAKRQLAQIERFNGNTEEANQLQEEADAAFDEYANSVSTAETNIQEGQRAWETIQNNGITLMGQPFLLNPIRYSSYNSHISTVRQSYDKATSKLEKAGATNRLATVSSTEGRLSFGLLVAQASLLISVLIYIGGAGGVIYRTIKQMYQYSRDAEEVTSGDFLLN